MYIYSMEIVRTHTYWMSFSEYVKWSNNKEINISFNNDKTKIRTHIFFE
jgi:hypothetical protein